MVERLMPSDLPNDMDLLWGRIIRTVAAAGLLVLIIGTGALFLS
jgi:hypothetical protein